MSIQFHCQGCGKAFRVRDEMAGQQARCKVCGTIVAIPTPEPLGFDTSLGPAPNLTPQQANPQFGRTAPSGSSSGLHPAVWVAIGVGSAVALLIVFLIVVQSLTSPPDPVAMDVSDNPSSLSPTSNTTPARPTSSDNGNRVLPPRRMEPQAETFYPSNGVSRPSPFSNRTPGATNTTQSHAARADTPSGGIRFTSSEFQIPIGRREKVTFGSTGCPVFVLGNNVWDVKSLKIVQELQGSYEQRGLTALSKSGRYFVGAQKSPNQRDTPVRVWDCTTGALACEIPGDKERFVDVLSFAGEHSLALAGRLSDEIQIWNLQTCKQTNSIEIPKGISLNQGKLDFASDGQYCATVGSSQVSVLKVDTGQVAAVMASPKYMPDPSASAAQAVTTENSRAAEASRQIDKLLHDQAVYRTLKALKFSPDGQELAAFSTDPVPRLVVWNNRGKAILDEPLMLLYRKVDQEYSLQWLPDRSGWLVSGHLYDGESGRIVLGVRKVFRMDHLSLFALDSDRLLGTFPHNLSALEVLRVPWDDIRASIKQLNEGGHALLSPAVPVSMRVELEGLHGDRDGIAQKIRNAMTARLARDGIRVQEEQSTYFHIKFAEQTSEAIPIYVRQPPSEPDVPLAGPAGADLKGSLVIELIAPGKPQPVWRHCVGGVNSCSLREAINNDALRENVLHGVTERIIMFDIDFPYFIPASQDQLALPVLLR